MDVNLLTIGNMFSQPAGPVRVEPKLDESPRDTRFSPTREDPQPPLDATRQTTPSDARSSTQTEPAGERRKDFREVIDKQTEKRNPAETSARPKPAQQDAEANTSDQPDAVETVLAQGAANFENATEKGASTTEPKTSQQLAQLIDGAEIQNARSAAAAAPTSAQAKLSATATKSQIGSEAVSTDAIKHMPAAVSAKQAENTSELPTSNGTASETKGIPKVSSAQQLAAEASAAGSVKTTHTGKEQTTAVDAALAAPAKTTATSATGSAGELSAGNAAKTTAAAENKAPVDAVHGQNSGKDAGVAAQPAQIQPSTPQSSKVIATGENPADSVQEPLQTAELEAGGAQRTPTRPVGFGTKNPGHLGNNVENSAAEPAQFKTTTGQTETGSNSDSGGRPLADPAQILSQAPAQTPVMEQAPIFAVQTEPTAPSEQPSTAPGDPLGNVGNQVLESVRSSLSQQTGDKEISIQLNPPELGKVSVKFQEQGSEITGTLEVSKAQTRTEIEHALPEIVRSLADSGVAVKRLEVVLSQNEQSGQHSARDPLLQDGQFQQHDSANSGSPDGQQQTVQTHYGPAGRGRYQYQSASDSYEMLVTNNSINMLV